MGRFALTNPMQLGQPIVNGQNVLSSAIAISPQGGLVSPGLAIASNLISIQSTRFGTLTADCTVDVEAAIDGGVNFGKTGHSFTNAELSVPGGRVLKTIQMKATHIRFVLNPGTMIGANGLSIRVLD